MRQWQTAWRALAPFLPVAGLEALLTALRTNNPAIIRGCATSPAGDVLALRLDCEGADPLGYALWKGLGLRTVEQVRDAHAEACLLANEQLDDGEDHHRCRWLLTWVDSTPREEMLRELASEVEMFLERSCDADAKAS